MLLFFSRTLLRSNHGRIATTLPARSSLLALTRTMAVYMYLALSLVALSPSATSHHWEPRLSVNHGGYGNGSLMIEAVHRCYVMVSMQYAGRDEGKVWRPGGKHTKANGVQCKKDRRTRCRSERLTASSGPSSQNPGKSFPSRDRHCKASTDCYSIV